jgi:hypothetical protein
MVETRQSCHLMFPPDYSRDTPFTSEGIVRHGLAAPQRTPRRRAEIATTRTPRRLRWPAAAVGLAGGHLARGAGREFARHSVDPLVCEQQRSATAKGSGGAVLYQIHPSYHSS